MTTTAPPETMLFLRQHKRSVLAAVAILICLRSFYSQVEAPPMFGPSSAGHTNVPVSAPTSGPTDIPTMSHSSNPTTAPVTPGPSAGSIPAAGPTSEPANASVFALAPGPTEVPTNFPSNNSPPAGPTTGPSAGMTPTGGPANVSVSAPTDSPTSSPSSNPTQAVPTAAPTPFPTMALGTSDYVKEHSQDYPRLCGGCTMKVVPALGNDQFRQPMTCGDLMDQKVAEKNKLLKATVEDYLQAAKEIAQSHPSYCQRCDPDQCGDADKQYLSIDVAAPKINRASTPWFNSLPVNYTKHFSRFPLEAFEDFHNYFSKEENLQTSRRYGVDLNPSIIPLPKDQIPHYLTPEQKKEVVYLASWRVSNNHDCFPPEMGPLSRAKGKHLPSDMNKLGLALLREDLTLIDDVLLDSTSHQFGGGDYRLFLLHGQVFITTWTRIAPIWLNKPLHNSTHLNEGIVLERKDVFDPVTYKMKMYLREQVSCCQSTHCAGKNFQYFESKGKVYVETRPMEPHIVEVVDVDAPCVNDAAKNDSLLFLSESMPNEPSFFTNDEYYFSSKGHHKLPYQRMSGTAGIIRIQKPSSNIAKQDDEDGEELLVGISHRKIHMGQNGYRNHNNLTFALRQYMSYFYAFNPEPPFDVVAMSGAFCLGYPDDSELSPHAPKDHHVVLEWLRKQPFIMAEKKLDCPFITFVTGITESPIDPTKVVIGYGVNDCMSRFVEVDKSEIIRLLFPKQSSTAATGSDIAPNATNTALQ